MFSVANRAQYVQEADGPCPICLAWSLDADDPDVQFAAVSSIASPIALWFPATDQERLESHVLSALGILAPTAGHAGPFHLTSLGVRVAMARVLMAEELDSLAIAEKRGV